MEVILKQVEDALNSGLYYLAVVIALTLPDICAALESDSGAAHHSKYKQWYAKWLQHKYPMIGQDDIYALRCGLNHRGKARAKDGHSFGFDSVVFVIPHVSAQSVASWHTQVSERDGTRVLALDVALFCHDIIHSVERWYDEKHADPNVAASISRVLRFRPDGLPPHFVGMPVIA
jgi:hypothetical protein